MLLLLGGEQGQCIAPASEDEKEERGAASADRSAVMVLKALAFLSESAPPQLVRELLSLYLHLR